MWQVFRRRPSPAMVVALAALFVALAGAAVAAAPRVSGDALIKIGTLSGNRLRKHTVTGIQINLNRLGKVPLAKTADTAANAVNATHAGTADTATDATNAANAQNAVNAQTATKANSLPGLSWTNLTLQNGATVYGSGSYGTPSYTKDAEGFVHLSGALDASGVSGTFATLPSGFRPTRAHNEWLRAAATNGSSDPHLVDIYIDSASGGMEVELGAGATGAFVDLEGLTFYAG